MPFVPCVVDLWRAPVRNVWIRMYDKRGCIDEAWSYGSLCAAASGDRTIGIWGTCSQWWLWGGKGRCRYM